MISIIVRSKNEEKWIASCLKKIFSQEYRDFEVILVDNNSTDRTVEKARAFDVKIVTIDQFRPGAAINTGIRESRGELIAILSAHCIPTDRKWLGKLAANFANPEIAGVYGRQEPMSFTPDRDKRDLLNTFGLDRRIQEKDSFFHNANSMIRRDAWQRFPFDEEVTNIEDRVWAKAVLAAGYKLAYEPEASVYHWHGIHQDGDRDRCKNVVRILESLQENAGSQGIEPEGLEILALIPEKGPPRMLNGHALLAYTVAMARQSRFITRTVVSTDNLATAALAKRLGADAPFLRPGTLSEDHVDLASVLRFSIEQLETAGYYPDLVVMMQTTFPFRPKGFIDRLIMQAATSGVDSVLAVQPEYKSCWRQTPDGLKELGAGFMPRQFKDPIYIGLSGLATVTHPALLRAGDRFGEKIGVVEITDPASALEIRDQQGLNLAASILPAWWRENGAEPALLEAVNQ